MLETPTLGKSHTALVRMHCQRQEPKKGGEQKYLLNKTYTTNSSDIAGNSGTKPKQSALLPNAHITFVVPPGKIFPLFKTRPVQPDGRCLANLRRGVPRSHPKTLGKKSWEVCSVAIKIAMIIEEVDLSYTNMYETLVKSNNLSSAPQGKRQQMCQCNLSTNQLNIDAKRKVHSKSQTRSRATNDTKGYTRTMAGLGSRPTTNPFLSCLI